MSDTPDPFATYLERIAERTRGGEIAWARSARWVLTTRRQTQSGEKTMLIQRVPSGRLLDDPLGQDAEYDFQFQVVNVKDGQIEVSIDNRRTPALLVSLRSLYDAADRSVGSHSRRVLSELAES